MAQTFKTGDVVRLKSGSPDMTVKRYSTVSRGDVMAAFMGMDVEEKDPADLVMVECGWFDGAKRRSGEFHQDTLELVK